MTEGSTGEEGPIGGSAAPIAHSLVLPSALHRRVTSILTALDYQSDLSAEIGTSTTLQVEWHPNTGALDK
jgi:hypothetical protein